MKTLNQESTKIFWQLIQKLGKEDHVKLTAPNYLPLSIEQIGSGIHTPFGEAKLYAISHYYIHNGVLMRDPEMCFLVVDDRKAPDQISRYFVCPQLFRQDNLGIYEESIKIDKNEVSSCITKWQFAHCAFANQWLRNIRIQGFLK